MECMSGRACALTVSYQNQDTLLQQQVVSVVAVVTKLF